MNDSSVKPEEKNITEEDNVPKPNLRTVCSFNGIYWIFNRLYRYSVDGLIFNRPLAVVLESMTHLTMSIILSISKPTVGLQDYQLDSATSWVSNLFMVFTLVSVIMTQLLLLRLLVRSPERLVKPRF